MSITIKETIPGSGDKWTIQPVMDRWTWLGEHLLEGEYKCWWGGLKSDDFYIQFNDDQHALAYKLKWMIK